MLKDQFRTHQAINDKQQQILTSKNTFRNNVSPYTQQSQRQSSSKKLKNYQVAKLLKLEKIINQLSKEISIDKMNVIFMMLGDNNVKKIESMVTGNKGKGNKVDAGNSPIH